MSKDKYLMGIVIPCFNEYHYIFNLLDSLKNNKTFFKQTRIIIVVNNRQGEDADNLRTVDKFHTSYNLSNIKVLNYTQDNCFDNKQGVGLARSLGFDALQNELSVEAPYIWLDADCLVADNFLEGIQQFYSNSKNMAGWISFEHQKGENKKINDAIKLYEIFLYHHWQELAKAKTPYAYPTIGSTITCRREVYEKSGGCDEKKMAGEDFYFLQNLTKRGYLFQGITTTTVFPSARLSERVPFGTGKKLIKIIEEGYLEVYNPKCYEIVGYFIAHILEEDFLNTCPYENLKQFLEQQGFFVKWQKIKNNSKKGQELQNFHRWFDAFKVFKLISFLNESYPPKRQRVTN